MKIMLGRKIIKGLNLRAVGSGGLRITSSFNTTWSASDTENIDEESKKPERKLKQWRKPPEVEPSIWSIFKNPNTDPANPEKPKPKPLRILPLELKKWFSGKRRNYLKYDQRFIKERHQTLGCDLAAAHFLVFRKGKVKFYGQSEWKVLNDEGTCDLPDRYDPTWKITHLDASGVDLYYEGVENFLSLGALAWASFKGNQYFDDWCMDKVASEFPNMEYLDVSDCPMLTERGLEALYRLYSLRTLIVTDFLKQPSFELTCALLEDCCPELTIEILDPPEPDDKDKNK